MVKDPLIGQILHDTHKVIRRMGCGGMGAVYEAHHVRLKNQRFAIKVLHTRMLHEEKVFARFRREAELATSIGHPNIVFVLDFYETDDGRPCMVMEYLEGEDLGQALRRKGKLRSREVIAIISQVASALAAVHDKSVVHRDLKPGNIFLLAGDTGTPKVKVLDFGISKILNPKEGEDELTADLSVLGTPQYMAPEQASGQVAQVDHRTDIFGLGVIAYRLLTGAYPFEADNAVGFVRAICDDPHVPITNRDSTFGEDVEQVFCQVLAKDKEERYQRVEHFAADLARALAPLSQEPLDASQVQTLQQMSGKPTLVQTPLPSKAVVVSPAGQEGTEVLAEEDLLEEAEENALSLQKTSMHQAEPAAQRVTGVSAEVETDTTLTVAVGEEAGSKTVTPRWLGMPLLAGALMGALAVILSVLLVWQGGEEPVITATPAVAAASAPAPIVPDQGIPDMSPDTGSTPDQKVTGKSSRRRRVRPLPPRSAREPKQNKPATPPSRRRHPASGFDDL